MSDILNPEVECTKISEYYTKNLKKKLSKQLNYTIKNSDFYQKKLRIKDFNINNVIETYAKVPFTEKSELLFDQINNPPFGTNVCVNIKKIIRVHRTSGTTGRPLYLTLTNNDIDNIIKVGKRCFYSSGLRPEDTVVHCLNYCLWMGGITDHQCLEATGAAVLPFGVGNSENLINTLIELKPTAIHCTPSYLSKLELLLSKKFHILPSELPLVKGFFAGESGLQNDSYRRMIERKWDIKAMNANYGLSDVLSIMAAECAFQNGLHFLAYDRVYVELIDPATERRLKMEDGVRGEFVITNLAKESQPLIRFRTHDYIEILSNEFCRCGRKSFRFKVLGRTDDMLVIKGINVFPGAISDIISEYLNYLTGEYQVQVSNQNPIEKITIKLELTSNISQIELKRLKNEINTSFKETLNISPKTEFVKKETLLRTEGKMKRVIKV